VRQLIKKLLREQVESQSNFEKLMDRFRENFPEEYKDKVDEISEFVRNYILDHGFQIKFLNSCSTGFYGVRTKKFIIICSPNTMQKIGDFIYTIFHEIRHEEQMSENMLNLPNPLTGDMEDFEELYRNYWQLELDADEFAKKKVAELILKLGLPLEIASEQFSLSPYVQNYAGASLMVKKQIKDIVGQIKNMKKMGMSYEDISDHPFVKQHLDKLEDFI
jgi:hypothetical protein